jgi:hypothetical protein
MTNGVGQKPINLTIQMFDINPEWWHASILLALERLARGSWL